MPSFLELLQSSSGDDGAPRPTSDGAVPLDVLASVKHEGGRRRRRRQRRNLVVGGVALVAVAVPAFAVLGGDGDAPEEVRSAEVADAPSTTAERDRPTASTTSTTVDPTEVLGVTIERTPEEAATDSTATTTPTTARPSRPAGTVPTTAPPATQPPLVCENSFDRACGAFSWSPAPGANGDLDFAVVGSTTVAIDTPLTFDVVISDGDAVPFFADDDTDGTLLASGCTTDGQRFGPWTPPAPSGGSITHTVHVPAQSSPGTYLVTVTGTSLRDCAYDPYGSVGSRTFQIEVTAP